MVKAFDFQDLVKRLEAKGLPIAEKALKDVTSEILDWVSESCVLEGGFAAVAVPLVPLIKAQILAVEDKIDGIAGN